MEEPEPTPLHLAIEFAIAAAFVAGSLVYGVWCGVAGMLSR
jgi:hypothetical protein